MWIVNARLCHLEGGIGVLHPGAYGDVVISNIDPIDDIAAFARHETALSHVIQNGNVVVDRSSTSCRGTVAVILAPSPRLFFATIGAVLLGSVVEMFTVPSAKPIAATAPAMALVQRQWSSVCCSSTSSDGAIGGWRRRRRRGAIGAGG